MVRAEKDTAGPIGKGTRFRSAVRSAGRIAEMVIETTEYDRPRLLASTTTMEQMEIEYTLTFEPVTRAPACDGPAKYGPRVDADCLGHSWAGWEHDKNGGSGRDLKSHLESAPVAGQ